MPNDTEPLLAEPLTVAISGNRTETIVTIDGEFDAGGTGWFGACIGTALETHPER
jgi:hypothetical protein